MVLLLFPGVQQLIVSSLQLTDQTSVGRRDFIGRTILHQIHDLIFQKFLFSSSTEKEDILRQLFQTYACKSVQELLKSKTDDAAQVVQNEEREICYALHQIAPLDERGSTDSISCCWNGTALRWQRSCARCCNSREKRQQHSCDR